MPDKPITNALTFDIEEYFHVSAFEGVIPKSEWGNWESRVEYSTNLILDLLSMLSTTATFFTLGIVAKNHPQLIHRIVSDGHELACHGFEHIRVADHTSREFFDDISRAKITLEDVSGVGVNGFRAASFSINSIDHWAFDEIEKAGFSYSSSIYPIKHDLYGIPSAPRVPFNPIAGNDLLEIPVTTFRACQRNFPAGGGGYFRLYPYLLTKKLISAFHNSVGAPANMYFHPWEFDPNQPRPNGISAKTKFRHYVNQSKSMQRLERLVKDFRWASMQEAYGKNIVKLKNIPEVN